MGRQSLKSKQNQILLRRIRNVRTFSRSLQKEIEEEKEKSKSNKGEIITLSSNLTQQIEESKANKDQINAFTNNLTQQVEESKANKDQIIIISNNLTQQVEESIANKDKIITLSNNLTSLMDSPYLNVCGYQSVATSASVIITYSKPLEFNHTNIPYSGGLDPDTGVFTAPISGIYMASASGQFYINSNNPQSTISFRKNQIMFTHSKISAYFSDGVNMENFSREIPLHLNQGDKLDLYVQQVSYGIFEVNFCIALNLAVDSISSDMDMQTNNDEDDEHVH